MRATIRRVLAGLATVGAASAALATPAGAATPAAAPRACVGTVQITSFAFVPPSIPAGNSSTATLKAKNCTAQTLQVRTTWTGSWLSASGTPAGCPAIDPLLRSVTFPPNGSVTTGTTYLVFAGCTANALQVTVQLASTTGAGLGSATATLTITH